MMASLLENNMNRENKRKKLAQLSYQVAILVLVLVSISCTILSIVIYNVSYKDMIASLEERGEAVKIFLSHYLEPSLFNEIITYEDMNTESYKHAHQILKYLKEITTAKYLYTATTNKEGELIYHIDGLSLDDKDFRKPGDLIEIDFQSDLLLALSGEDVLSGQLLITEWGEVFVAYYPLTDNAGNVVGALGLEFPATTQYAIFLAFRNFTILFIIITCIFSFVISKILFKRISNPYFKHIYNTDSLTGLKNRIAYDADSAYLIEQKILNKYILVLADLNNLKVVNDQKGHKKGDEYILLASIALMNDNKKDHMIYRIGGDEFAILFSHQNSKRIEDYINNTKLTLSEICKNNLPNASISMGMAYCTEATFNAWEKVQEEADICMYADKKNFYNLCKSTSVQ
ncbi:hypothetical protein AN642_01400 [Epulopiscium sp. SCG-B10WGA-EpuloA2]|nr:hypothetical protein AN642_01400 [Epulopiscium sp. SCG-B10WGA-EpuloA2]